MRFRLLPMLLLTACAAGQPAGSDTEADKAAIRARLDTVSAAHNAADAEAWANTATEDIVLMVDGGPSISGRAAILEWIKAFYAANKVSDMKAEAVEIEIAGDWAYSREQFSATLTPAGGGTARRMDGKEIAIWRRQPDGVWRASRVIFNSNLPPAAP
jgi:uncharacterized protein (TIGR02246 family)